MEQPNKQFLQQQQQHYQEQEQQQQQQQEQNQFIRETNIHPQEEPWYRSHRLRSGDSKRSSIHQHNTSINFAAPITEHFEISEQQNLLETSQTLDQFQFYQTPSRYRPLQATQQYVTQNLIQAGHYRPLSPFTEYHHPDSAFSPPPPQQQQPQQQIPYEQQFQQLQYQQLLHQQQPLISSGIEIVKHQERRHEFDQMLRQHHVHSNIYLSQQREQQQANEFSLEKRWSYEDRNLLSTAIIDIKSNRTPRKSRWRPTQEQKILLNEMWDKNPYPDTAEKAELIQQMGGHVTQKQITSWFKHKRENDSQKGKFEYRYSATAKFTSEQIAYLEEVFSKDSYAKGRVLQDLADQLQVNLKRVQNWFKHRRSRLAQQGKFEFKSRSTLSPDQVNFLRGAFFANPSPVPEVCESLSQELHVNKEQVSRWFSNERSKERRKYREANKLNINIKNDQEENSSEDNDNQNLSELSRVEILLPYETNHISSVESLPMKNTVSNFSIPLREVQENENNQIHSSSMEQSSVSSSSLLKEIHPVSNPLPSHCEFRRDER